MRPVQTAEERIELGDIRSDEHAIVTQRSLDVLSDFHGADCQDAALYWY